MLQDQGNSLQFHCSLVILIQCRWYHFPLQWTIPYDLLVANRCSICWIDLCIIVYYPVIFTATTSAHITEEVNLDYLYLSKKRFNSNIRRLREKLWIKWIVKDFMNWVLMEIQYNCIGLFLGGEGWAEAHGDCDHLWSSHDNGETLAQGDSRRTQGRLQWRGEQVEVGVVRGTSVGEAAGGCATRNRKFSSENWFEINHNKM